jgi:hypothetical protein
VRQHGFAIQHGYGAGAQGRIDRKDFHARSAWDQTASTALTSGT